jgi:heme exporter protein A
VVCSERACREVLARMGLAGREDDEVRHLSQGQRRRLVLSRVQLSERPVWLLDEPLADLDANGEQALAQCLSLHAGQGGLAVVTTHRDIGSPCRCTQSLNLDEFADARRVELDH